MPQSGGGPVGCTTVGQCPHESTRNAHLRRNQVETHTCICNDPCIYNPWTLHMVHRVREYIVEVCLLVSIATVRHPRHVYRISLIVFVITVCGVVREEL